MQRPVVLILNLCMLCLIPNMVTKTFSTCELMIELVKQGFPEYQISDRLCLIEAESSKRTDVIGGPDDDGSFDFGLFQINDRYWCSNNGNPGKGCNIECKDLLSDDISVASKCAQKIYSIQGFNAWLGWKNECRRKTPKIYC